MKKLSINLILSVFVLALSMLSTVTVSAQTTDAEKVAELQAQVKALQTQAKTLQAAAQASGVKVTMPGCKGTTGFSATTGQPCSITNLTGKIYNFGSVTLKNGSTGEAVKELQRFLNAKLDLGLKVDGKLGPKTIEVIKKWQKDHGLTPDGLIGKNTKVLMNTL
jgi:murein L,D-transpeptidase YcbB/YkuD